MSKTVEMHKIKQHKQAVIPKKHDTYHNGIGRRASPADLLLDIVISFTKGNKFACSHTTKDIGKRYEEPDSLDSLSTTDLALVKS